MKNEGAILNMYICNICIVSIAIVQSDKTGRKKYFISKQKKSQELKIITL